jgi:hypothetical protein
MTQRSFSEVVQDLEDHKFRNHGVNDYWAQWHASIKRNQYLAELKEMGKLDEGHRLASERAMKRIERLRQSLKPSSTN